MGEKTAVKRIPLSCVPIVDEILAAKRASYYLKPSKYMGRLPNDVLYLSNILSKLDIPLYQEKVAVGFPSPTEGYLSNAIDLNELLVTNSPATIIIRCGGLSMLDAGIDLDDLLIVDRSPVAEHIGIVLANVNNEFAIKRLVKAHTGLICTLITAVAAIPTSYPATLTNGPLWACYSCH
ncbi:S24 family peptidase [Moraxella canis]|uniref:S24 family peptidase n=1 Tax=Moraxella canis TaxID=90239 RepID=A0ABZ0WXR9_9GAMM|nr:S24 family peptidase [Moraxella canis]WQE03895.1 S24 family peptidase [Moraxella canis]